MKNLILTVYLLLALAATALAGAVETDMQQVMTEAGFTRQQSVQVQSMIDSAQQKGLPADAVTSKVYEGIAKHVSPDRIVRAVERVTSRYEFGYNLAKELAQEQNHIIELGNTVAAGVAAGLTPQDMEKIAASLRSRSEPLGEDNFYSLAEETMRTARDLSRQGVSSTTTTEVVEEAMQRGYSADEMQTMRSSFNKQGARGNVESLAKNYSNAIAKGVDARSLEAHSRDGSGAGGMHGNRGDASGNDNSGNSGAGGGNSEGSGGGDSDSAGGSGGSGGGGNAGGGGGNSGGGGGSGGGSGNSGGSGNGGGKR